MVWDISTCYFGNKWLLPTHQNAGGFFLKSQHLRPWSGRWKVPWRSLAPRWRGATNGPAWQRRWKLQKVQHNPDNTSNTSKGSWEDTCFFSERAIWELVPGSLTYVVGEMERRIAITYFLYISLIASLRWELNSPRIPFKIFSWVERFLDVSSAIVEWYFDNPQPLVLITLAGASLGAGKHMIKPTFWCPIFGGANPAHFSKQWFRSPLAFGRWKHARIKATDRGCSTKCSRGTSRLAWVNRWFSPALETSDSSRSAAKLQDMLSAQWSLPMWNAVRVW